MLPAPESPRPDYSNHGWLVTPDGVTQRVLPHRLTHDGQAHYIWPGGDVYEGAWQAGKRSGFGKYLSAAGVRYEGEWIANQRVGAGLQTWPDGTSHDGMWEHNQPLGVGVRSLVYGVTVTGYWSGAHISNGLIKLPSGNEYGGPILKRDGSAHPKLLEWLNKIAAEPDADGIRLRADLLSLGHKLFVRSNLETGQIFTEDTPTVEEVE